jgi:dipeptidyl aminopeptidase/acylaminoacyl peptidase
MRKVDERDSVVIENEGQKIFGILHRPLHKTKSPAVLMCHGLAGHKTGKYRLYVLLAEKLALAGIASLRIDFRGSGDSEGDFNDMTLEGEVSDALKGLEYLETSPYIDNKRIGIFGRSVGGIVALIAANQHRHISSLATWAPLFDGHQWMDKWNLLHSAEISEEHRMAMMRVNGQVPGYEFFRQLFKIDMKDELQALENVPLLHIHGEHDVVVSMEHAARFEKARKKAENITQFIRLPQSDHDFSHPVEQEQALNETCNWFLKTL